MKSFITLLFLLISSTIFAQQSIGFTDSTDFKYLIDYRLPDWGYSNFYLSNVGLGINGSIDNSNLDRVFFGSNSFQNNRFENKQYNAGFGIRPVYDYFRESEELNLQTNTSLQFSMNRSNRSRENENNSSGIINSNDVKTNSSSKRVDFDINLASQHFINPGLFIQANWRSNISYNFSSVSDIRNELPETDTESKTRSIYLEPSVGIGFGRIRNVTPVIRALRLNERYKALGNTSLTKQDIEFTSVQFTRYRGYQGSYDRPLKYFWNDLDTGINGKLSRLDTFDLFYLNDVFNENVGSRFEGYSVTITGGYTYLNSLSKQNFSDATPDQRDFSISRTANTQLSAIWYKNLNLNHQLNLSLFNQLFFPLEKRNSTEISYESQFNGRWLWVLADRLQLSNQLRLTYLRDRIKNVESHKEHNLLTSISSQLSYFVENKLLLSASINVNQRHQSEDFDFINTYSQNLLRNTLDLGLSISMRYYLNRNLF